MMILFPRSQRTRLLQLVLLASVLAALVDAFAPLSIPTVPSSLSITRLQSSIALEESSEWYCPPPPKKQEIAAGNKLPPAGQMALQTEVTTAHELETLLQDGDERLTIVKFYASWCVFLLLACGCFSVDSFLCRASFSQHFFFETLFYIGANRVPSSLANWINSPFSTRTGSIRATIRRPSGNGATCAL